MVFLPPTAPASFSRARLVADVNDAQVWAIEENENADRVTMFTTTATNTFCSTQEKTFTDPIAIYDHIPSINVATQSPVNHILDLILFYLILKTSLKQDEVYRALY